MHRASGPYEVMQWRSAPKGWLTKALKDFLRTGAERGGDLLPTARNVEELYLMGHRASQVGYPAFVASRGIDPIAFVLWVKQESGGLDTKYKHTVAALGSYTDPKYRTQGVAAFLRDEALHRCRQLGVERVVGPVHTANQRGLEVFMQDYGAWPVSVNFELVL